MLDFLIKSLEIRLWKFLNGGSKIERTVNDVLTKIGHNFRKKNCFNRWSNEKKCYPKLVLLTKKNQMNFNILS